MDDTIQITITREQAFQVYKLLKPNASIRQTFLLIAKAMRDKHWI